MPVQLLGKEQSRNRLRPKCTYNASQTYNVLVHLTDVHKVFPPYSFVTHRLNEKKNTRYFRARYKKTFKEEGGGGGEK